MNVSFNPSVNFKSADTNLISQAVKGMQQRQNQTVTVPKQSEPEIRYPDSWVHKDNFEKRNSADFEKVKNKIDELQLAFEEGKSIDTILKGKYWEKEYDPATNTVHAKIPNSYDGNEYTVYPDGKVVVTNGWGKNEVEREANKELADYISQRKAQYQNSVHTGFEKKTETEPKSNAFSNAAYTEAELDEKANIFNERLKNRKWKKEYLPDNDIIVIRNKRMKDDVEYMIKNDGTVMETGLRNKAVTIIEPNSESAKTFAKYKRKLDPNAPKTSLWMRGKEVVADVWKFLSVSATMGIATAKGLWQGALTGAAVLGGATILKGAMKVIKNEKTLSEIITHPLKTAGKTGKALAIIAGGAVLVGHLIAGRMKANQNSAVIEHKVDVPHNND